MRIAIIGSSGQLGSDLARLLPARGHDILPYSGRAQLDICQSDQISRMLDSSKPHALINSAAFHNVDLCESQPEPAYRTNVLAVRDLALACEARKILFLQVGTDYVFGSHTDHDPIPESAPVSPNSIYSLTRFGGDSMTLTHAPTTGYVVPSCGLFGLAGCKLKGGLNFVDSMIKLAKEGKPLRVVNDQFVAPTPTDDLALQLAALLEHSPLATSYSALSTKHSALSATPGLYHAVSHGQTTWFNFAKTALELAKIPHSITPVSSSAFAAPARRPAYSVLDNARLRALNLDLMHPWQDSLARYIQSKYPPP